MLLFSPITPFEFNNQVFYVKRDDLLDKNFNGNKARKFYYFLKRDFPNIKKVISFGSNQSNAMYSLSVLAKIKGWEFIYYTNHISSYLKNNPQGNYLYALKNGMKIIECGLSNEEMRNFVLNLRDKNTLIIEEGGRVKESEEGIKNLADEIKEFAKKHNLKIFLPSGTGATAFFLAKNLDIEVITTPCVGDKEYLLKQLFLLGEIPYNLTVLSPRKKFIFGKLYKELYLLWKELKLSGIEFDLLYDPIGWDTIKHYNLKNILYIHQGGLNGNESLIKRYKYKFNF
ncbi:1-aminocyclopropane-1-carboxylate deaminase/D-cysteine desulfhydrase [Caminibacter mediatlanticus TB-2]|uniref:1-aminocyclopropane-1-carboxylate deaminase/D-cysteine desulfhydrase n=1 Tax=Caminibacter mediatlanticus TB-2 TaxID=391592 RepID=A0ABX5V7V2_9BACT|nr:1-aminocyclopropane-1-carboxylate deaminase/D-cysteine desulfhydrase [Caminibacter mediatlanticus]QCT94313.1 1-aminocyclopropane-1-carboxylate deaminase/D-cysteine desulfhydrase [Caminibacter mediatlanticus TB-2]